MFTEKQSVMGQVCYFLLYILFLISLVSVSIKSYSVEDVYKIKKIIRDNFINREFAYNMSDPNTYYLAKDEIHDFQGIFSWFYQVIPVLQPHCYSHYDKKCTNPKIKVA